MTDERLAEIEAWGFDPDNDPCLCGRAHSPYEFSPDEWGEHWAGEELRVREGHIAELLAEVKRLRAVDRASEFLVLHGLGGYSIRD